MPWLHLLALCIALYAQYTLGPPNRIFMRGILLYLTGAVLLTWSYFRREKKITPSPDRKTSEASFTIRRFPLLISLPLVLLAFLSCGENHISMYAFFAWMVAIILLVWALKLPSYGSKPWRDRGKEIVSKACWPPKIQMSALIMVAGVAVVLFFRLYRLIDVPPEMTSDHAEKLLDVADVLRGETRIFFPRNAGREGLQMYMSALTSMVFGTGLTFFTLKIVTALTGLLTVLFIYLIGKEIENRSVGFYASMFAGIAYWPNVISRVGLRFPFYPLFTALTVYFLMRGINRSDRNQFIYAGLSLGFGFYGYTADRVLPLVAVVGFILFLMHEQSAHYRRQALWGLAIVAVMGLAALIPLARYIVEEPGIFFYRSLTRLTSLEQPLPGPAWRIFSGNLSSALGMFSYSGGNVFLASVPFYPALGIVSGALFHLGTLLLLFRYISKRSWLDLFLLSSIPLLMLPSMLSLAFPIENPNLYRTGGALVPVFLIAGISLDIFLKEVKRAVAPPWGPLTASVLGVLLFMGASYQNYQWVFKHYCEQYRLSVWNTAEIGRTIRTFADSMGDRDSAWVIPHPHWVDTRLVGINAGFPEKDYALRLEDVSETISSPSAQLFIVRPSDEKAIQMLDQLYPGGIWEKYKSRVPHKDFLLFYTSVHDG